MIALTLGNKEIKSFTISGVVTDILAHMKKIECQKSSGELHSFNPVENTGAVNDITLLARSPLAKILRPKVLRTTP